MEVTPAFGYVIAAAAGITMQATMINFASVGPRYKYMNKEYIKKHLAEEDDKVKKLTGSGIGAGCHPDNGSGRFGQHLPLEHWLRLTVAQRAAANYFEQLPQILALVLMSGLFNPKSTALVAVLYMTARMVYTFGFKSKSGVGGRGPGFVCCMLCQLGLFINTVYQGIKMTGALDQWI